MARLDSSIDSNFYDDPRFVTHIDDMAIESLTEFYRQEIDEALKRKSNGKVDILDLCSSWISHLPEDRLENCDFVAGVGMNEEELAANKQLYVHYCQDLNQNPTLAQFPDESFDLVCNVVSVDYLTSPKKNIPGDLPRVATRWSRPHLLFQPVLCIQGGLHVAPSR